MLSGEMPMLSRCLAALLIAAVTTACSPSAEGDDEGVTASEAKKETGKGEAGKPGKGEGGAGGSAAGGAAAGGAAGKGTGGAAAGTGGAQLASGGATGSGGAGGAEQRPDAMPAGSGGQMGSDGGMPSPTPAADGGSPAYPYCWNADNLGSETACVTGDVHTTTFIWHRKDGYRCAVCGWKQHVDNVANQGRECLLPVTAFGMDPSHIDLSPVLCVSACSVCPAP
jgi:hypothetical protein